MQADGEHMFLYHNRCLYVFFHGRVVQTLVHVCGDKLWLTPHGLVTLTTGDTDCDLSVWSWDSRTGKLVRCRRFPNPAFIVDFAGLWQNHVILCSSSGAQACYDLATCRRLAPQIFPPITDTNRLQAGHAFQDIVTVWPEQLRTLPWIRREDPHDGVFYDPNLNDYRRCADKGRFNVQQLCLTSDTVWGYHADHGLQLKCWARRDMKIRLPQLITLLPRLPDILVGKLFYHLWPHAVGRL